jgi:hypothetical protein
MTRKQIFLSDLKEKLNKDKAFPIYKKKITNEDLKLVFTDKELKKKSVIKSFTLIFGIFVLITGFFSADVIRMFVGLVFALISLFMEDPNKKFLKERIKKSSDHLISAFNHGLVNFHLMGGFGTISKDDTQLIDKDEE